MARGGQRALLTVAAVSAAVVVVSITTAVVLGGDIPNALWWLLVPVGMFGAGAVAVVALAIVVSRRAGGA